MLCCKGDFYLEDVRGSPTPTCPSFRPLLVELPQFVDATLHDATAARTLKQKGSTLYNTCFIPTEMSHIIFWIHIETSLVIVMCRRKNLLAFIKCATLIHKAHNTSYNTF